MNTMKSKELAQQAQQQSSLADTAETAAAVVARCRAALALHYERCQTYSSLERQLASLLLGRMDAGALQHTLATAVTPRFQEINAGLRQIQAEAAAAEGSTAGGGGEAARLGRLLVRWVDRLQDCEREHFRVRLQLVAAVVAHCAPCVPAPAPPPPAPAAASTKEKANEEEVVVVGEDGEVHAPIHSHSHGHGHCAREAEAEDRLPASSPEGEAAREPAAEADKPNGEAALVYSVHDGESCFLRTLVARATRVLLASRPPDERGPLASFTVGRPGGDADATDTDVGPARRQHFVDCSHALSLAAAGEEDDDGNNSHKSDDDDDDDEAEGRLRPLRLGRGASAAYYEPAAVARRCRQWQMESGAAALAAQQQTLQQRAADIAEELECEVVDFVAEQGPC